MTLLWVTYFFLWCFLVSNDFSQFVFIQSVRATNGCFAGWICNIWKAKRNIISLRKHSGKRNLSFPSVKSSERIRRKAEPRCWLFAGTTLVSASAALGADDRSRPVHTLIFQTETTYYESRITATPAWTLHCVLVTINFLAWIVLLLCQSGVCVSPCLSSTVCLSSLSLFSHSSLDSPSALSL